MLLSKLLIALSAAALATAYAVPSRIADGSYVSLTINGTETYLKMDEFLTRFPRTKGTKKVVARSPAPAGTSDVAENNPLMKRGRTFFCGCGYNMNDGDTNAAVAGLKDQFALGNWIYETSVPSWKSFFTIRGSVVAFVCSRQTFDFFSSPNKIGDGFGAITNACGRYIAGSKEYHDLNFGGSTIQGYMRYNGNGHDFCRDSTGSTAEHC